ncbi:hypothetical protein HO173_007074 [Letharia columbiana]|uniref:Uncharacterized protein n=1 Tax=Letharia columbiana TaxID=112416 RepID=A0A8H6L444_9LECA|nr:uncharacterized protein HO173_007074 [Letharia columbiana]KAF6234854.1 hypothetical protein HO173_007074 [Letharia columbiana]
MAEQIVSGGQNSLEHGGLALLRSTFLCEEQDVAVNDVHTPFVNLEIPDRTLGFKGWRIGVCVPRETDLGNDTRSAFGGKVHNGSYSGIKSLNNLIDKTAINAIISEIVRPGHRKSCSTE